MRLDKPYQITARFRAVLLLSHIYKQLSLPVRSSRFVLAAICLHVEIVQIRQAKRVSALWALGR